MSQQSHTAKATKSQSAISVTDQDSLPGSFSFLAAVSHAAYLRAKSRDFEPGHELEDWRAAEQQIGGAEATASV